MTTLRFTEYDEGLHDEMRKPFPAEYIEWKPQATPRTQSNEGWGLAVPYVDPRWYLERLDALVGPWGWTSEIIPINTNGDKLIVKLTVAGVTKMNVGEKDGGDKNTLASADAQAIKRACVEFGLGRYLYQFIPQTWVEMERKHDKAPWKFTPKAQNQLKQVAQAGTKDYLDYLGGKEVAKPTQVAPAPQAAPTPAPQAAPAPVPTPTPQPTAALGASGDLIPELNYEINAGGKAAEYTGITSGKIRLFHLVQAGDDGMGYLGWMANKWKNDDGKAAAAKVIEWRESGGVLPDEELDQGPQPPPQPAPQASTGQVAINPPGGVDLSTINDVRTLCVALGTTDFNGVWEKLVGDGVFEKSPPKPDETEKWVEAYNHMLSATEGPEVPF